MSERLWGDTPLYPFQEESIAMDYLRTQSGGGMIVCWGTGCGKSFFGMHMACLLAEDGRDGLLDHDTTVVLCEKGKLSEWVEDFETHTRLSVRKHHGPSRMKQLAKLGLPDVLVTTYETAKADLVKFVRPGEGKRGTRIEPGPLFDLIGGTSVLWLADESAAKLGNRTSDLYKSFDWVFRKQRKLKPTGHRVFGLTATPIETGYENAFNQGRLLFPDRMPTVGEFESWMVESRHPVYGTPKYNQDAVDDFVQLFRPVIDRRGKTDPDIMAQFPSKVERAVHVEMGQDQARLYRTIASLQAESEDPIPGLFTNLRIVAGHPAALVLAAKQGESKLSKMLVEEIGEDELLRIPSAKEQELLVRLRHVVQEEGEKAVIFTFFGQTVLPVLAKSLRAKGFKVYENHGGLGEHESAERRRGFRTDPSPCIFLTSDSGARGINLPEATHVYEYEGSLTYANHVQRIDRIHRISSNAPSVTCTTMVLDDTVEERILAKMLARNEQTDRLLGEEDSEHFLTAEDRKALFTKPGSRRSRSSLTPA